MFTFGSWSSPFDEAAEHRRQFLTVEEQARKVSWTTTAAPTTTLSCDDGYDLDLSDVEESRPLRKKEIAEHDPFEGLELTTVDVELNHLAERHQDIQGICSDMHTLNAIQTDLQGIVRTQDQEIGRMSWLAIEAFEETERGLSQLERAYHNNTIMASFLQSRRRKAITTASGIVMMVLMVAWAFYKLSDDEDPQDYESGDPKQFP